MATTTNSVYCPTTEKLGILPTSPAPIASPRSGVKRLRVLYSYEHARLVHLEPSRESIGVVVQRRLLEVGALQIIKADAINITYLRIGSLTYPIMSSLKCWHTACSFTFRVPSGAFWRLELEASEPEAALDLARILETLVFLQTSALPIQVCPLPLDNGNSTKTSTLSQSATAAIAAPICTALKSARLSALFSLEAEASGLRLERTTQRHPEESVVIDCSDAIVQPPSRSKKSAYLVKDSTMHGSSKGCLSQSRGRSERRCLHASKDDCVRTPKRVRFIDDLPMVSTPPSTPHAASFQTQLSNDSQHAPISPLMPKRLAAVFDISFAAPDSSEMGKRPSTPFAFVVDIKEDEDKMSEDEWDIVVAELDAKNASISRRMSLLLPGTLHAHAQESLPKLPPASLWWSSNFMYKSALFSGAVLRTIFACLTMFSVISRSREEVVPSTSVLGNNLSTCDQDEIETGDVLG